MENEKIKQLDNENIMHTYARYDVCLTHGKGVYAYDDRDKKYIDVSSGIGVNSLGYCNPGWVKAVTEQASKIQHISNYYYSPVAGELAEKLAKATGLSKVFFGNSGAEANECAIKVARKYSFDKYGQGRNHIVTLENSFHGRTIATLSATGQDVFHNYFFPFVEGFDYARANDIENLLSKITDKTCAVMLETVQGEGGVNILDSDYLKEVSKICDERDILLIVDEVQTGVCRTGKLYGYMHSGITPDIVTSAKGLGGGLPIGICMVGEKLSEVMGPSSHGTTFGSNPVVCAGAKYILDTVNNPEFIDEVNKKGEYIKEELLKIKGVKAVRQQGLMIGIEVEENAGDIAKKCTENGLLIITAKTLLRMLPPLNITYDEIDEALSILKKVMEG
ncbi:MAG: aspartate aminotransferase family protein [Oscillospiraceae bacterium]|nr:aspartate aminotransferase family protein [Oscillospiraceae bacterium]